MKLLPVTEFDHKTAKLAEDLNGYKKSTFSYSLFFGNLNPNSKERG